MKLGDVVPDFSLDSSAGPINWHEYIGGSWAVLCSHPADFTPVCTTELGTLAKVHAEFKARGVKVAALSCDTVENHKGWIPDVEAGSWSGGAKVDYPILADPKRDVAVAYGMLDPVAQEAPGLPLPCRAVFIINPDRKLAASILYPASTGRNFNEILRAIDSLQMTASHKVATPVDWKKGDKCVVVPAVSTEDAQKAHAGGVDVLELPSGKPYLRMVADPKA